MKLVIVATVCKIGARVNLRIAVEKNFELDPESFNLAEFQLVYIEFLPN